MVKKSKGRLLLGASYSVIEPLGILHLGGLARDLSWERNYHLVKDHDFEPFFEAVKDFKPNIIGFNIYTGNHLQLFEAYDRLKKDFPNIATIIGGPHATYFPSDSLLHSDYVVMSEGFHSLTKILNGEAEKGILTMTQKQRFPLPDREAFYREYPEHAKSKIKSFITMTGCPYKCTYCYNSSEPEDIKATPEIIAMVKSSFNLPVISDTSSCSSESKLNKLGFGRLFPFNVRSVNDVIAEAREIAEKWPTQVLYCQDDVHGFDIKEWLPQFSERYLDEVGIPYHAQMRWEMVKDENRLDILKDAGCFGLTLAIEAADPVIRKEVLDRAMPQELMYEGMKKLVDRDFKIRTEQITALPYGATTLPTKMNLDADLELVKLNVDLREQTGGPTMAWFSTFAPYAGVKLGEYSHEHGFYSIPDNYDVPDTFFDKSVLRFVKKWVGPDLKHMKDNSEIWLNETDLEIYRAQNAELRKISYFVTQVPQGHILAEFYLKKNEPFSYERLGRETQQHLLQLKNNIEAEKIIENMTRIKNYIDKLPVIDGLKALVPYFACLPKSELAIERAVKYAHEKGNGHLESKLLSTAVRHHLYDEVLYHVDHQERSIYQERYLAKV